jgi:exodeoxyribonuclease VII large subunit
VPDARPPDAPVPEERVPEDDTYRVGELDSAIAQALADAFPRKVWVRGEIAQYRVSANGHAYFDLVEKDDRRGHVRAKLSVALFRKDRQGVNRTLREADVALADGVEVRIRARIDFYPAGGRLQLIMDRVDPVFTVGKLAAERARVLRTLAAEGLLERQQALELPLVPLRIGLVTSGGSAAYHDFVAELEASAHAFRVVHVDVRVQGHGADRRIVYGLRSLGALDLDVIVVARGGGARSDLGAFDDELVARTIAQCPIPVVTGIGHEVDRTVADAVAHTYVKTPTAAAGLLLEAVDDFSATLGRIAHRVSLRARSVCTIAGRDLRARSARVQRTVPVVLDRERRTIDGHRRRTVEAGRRRARDASARVLVVQRTITTSATRGLRDGGRRLEAAEDRLRALDPRRVLERGYTITRTSKGKAIRRAVDAVPGEVLETETGEGTVHSRVEQAPVGPGSGERPDERGTR